MTNKKVEYHNFQDHSAKGYDDQEPNIAAEIELILQSFPGIDNKFLTVTLVGTQIAASLDKKMKFDSDTKRGWYTEQVEIFIATSEKDVTIRATAPDTASMTTSISQSTSSGMSGSVGTFNGDPTMNLAFTSSSGQSYSQAVPDFKLSNLSDLYKLHHVYSLSAIPNGGYSNPFSLEDKPDVGHAIGDLFQFKAPAKDYHTRLKEVTRNDGNAVCNLPTPSQAVFMTPSGNYDKKITLEITFKHKLAKVNVDDGAFKDHIHAEQKTHTVQKRFTVDFSQVANVDLSSKTG